MDYYTIASLPSGSLFAQIDEWSHVSLPVGPYHAIYADEAGKEWITTANADWSDIDCIVFNLAGGASGEDLYIDDLHFTGQIVREAWDISEVAAKNYYTRFLRNDAAVNDSLIASDDSGTAGQLTYTELVRRRQTPIVGMYWTPLAPTILPGQTVHPQACEQSDGTYRINKDFRVKQVKHVISLPHPTTIWNVTDDVTNSHAIGAPTAYDLLMEYAGALGHSEARDLKGSGIDNLLPRLSNSYA